MPIDAASLNAQWRKYVASAIPDFSAAQVNASCWASVKTTLLCFSMCKSPVLTVGIIWDKKCNASAIKLLTVLFFRVFWSCRNKPTKDKIMNNNKLEVVAEFVELPEGKKVEDIEEWFIRWGNFFYFIDGVLHEAELSAKP